MAGVRPEQTDGVTLERALRAVLLAIIVLLLLGAGASIATVVDRDRALSAARRYEEARTAVNAALSAVVDQQTAVRGFLLTGDPVFLDPYEPGRTAFDESIRRLRRSIGSEQTDIPTGLALLAAVEQAYQRWHAEVLSPELALAMEGRRDEAATIVASGAGIVRFAEVRQAGEQLREAVVAAERRAQSRTDDARRRVTVLLVSTFLTAAALAAGTAVGVRRWITAPLQALSRDVRRVAAGDVDHTVGLQGPAELARLAADVEGMRRRIRDELAAAVAAKEALEQQGTTVLQLRAQLAPTTSGLPTAVRVATRHVPAEGVLAGDWHDVVALAPGRVAAAVLDVSGHGPVAGVLALRAKELLLVGLRDGREPGEAIRWMAGHLGDTGDTFLTAAALVLDVPTGRCAYANAGHPPGLLVTCAGVQHLAPTGPLVGPFAGSWDTVEALLEPDAALVLYTDGLVEARDEAGQELGLRRLEDVLRAYLPGGPAAMVEACIEAVRDHRRGPLADDLTALALGRTGA